MGSCLNRPEFHRCLCPCLYHRHHLLDRSLDPTKMIKLFYYYIRALWYSYCLLTWSALGSYLQLSHTSPTESPSVSCWSVLLTYLQLSSAFSIPDKKNWECFYCLTGVKVSIFLPSPSMSSSHKSPNPSWSVSIWSSFLRCLQLSQTSPTKSRSKSSWLGL